MLNNVSKSWSLRVTKTSLAITQLGYVLQWLRHDDVAVAVLLLFQILTAGYRLQYFISYIQPGQFSALQRCHNERDGVSNHQPHDCLLSRLSRQRWKNLSSPPLAFVRGIHRSHRWIPRTRGQYRGKCFHLITSSWSEKICLCFHLADFLGAHCKPYQDFGPDLCLFIAIENRCYENQDPTYSMYGLLY